MENKTSKKYDILMIVWGLSLCVIELWLINLGFFYRINIPFIKAPYAKNLLILAENVLPCRSKFETTGMPVVFLNDSRKDEET